MQISRKKARIKKRKHIRKKISGTVMRPRLAVHRSNNHIYAQIIDDVKGHTLAQSSTLDNEIKSQIVTSATCEASAIVGRSIAQRAIAQGLGKVVFDRGGLLYHGRVKSLADAARTNGLEF